MHIRNRLFRGALSAMCAAFSSVALFLLAGVFLPSWLMELAYGPWEDLPVGAGFGVMLIAFPVGLFCLLMLPIAAVKFYRDWSPTAVAA